MATIRLVTVDLKNAMYYPGLKALRDPNGDFVVESADNPSRTKDPNCLLILFDEFYRNLEKHKKSLLENYPNAVICMVSLAENSDKIMDMKPVFKSDAEYCKAAMKPYCERAKQLPKYNLAGKIAGDWDMKIFCTILSIMSSPSNNSIVRAARCMYM